MKNLIFISTILFFFACSNADHTKHNYEDRNFEFINMQSIKDTVFQRGVERIIDSYNNLKDLLVESNFTGAQLEAKQLLACIGELDTKNIPASDKVIIETSIEKIQLDLEQFISTLSIGDQRKVFEPISDQMLSLCTKGLSNGDTLYVQYCPMAFEDHGAQWLSFSPTIMNPYWGDKMLHCGEIKQALVQ